MADGWAALGAALGGDSEKAYQEGRALGARTEEALATARAKVDENRAKMEVEEALVANGVPRSRARAMAAVFRGGGNIGDLGQAMLRDQEYGFRATAGDPLTTPDAANAALRGVATGPVDRYQKLGPRAVDDRFDAAGPQPLGDAMSDPTGEAARVEWIKYLAGLRGNGAPTVDDALTWDKNFQQVRDFGGVPGMVRGGPGGATTTALAAPGTAPATAPTQPSVTPLASAADVGANVAEIERQKVIGKARGEAAASLPQSRARFENHTAAMDDVMGSIDDAIADVSGWTAGPGGAIIGQIWGTPAYDLRRTIDTIKANIGFDRLQQMREESKTGGALGQVAVQELEFLQSTLGSLDQAQSPGQLVQMLAKARGHYNRMRAAAARDFAAAEKMAGATPPPPLPGVAPTMSPPLGPTAAPTAEPTATGPNGEKIVFRNGQWQPL